MNAPSHFLETDLPLDQNPWLEKNTNDFLYHLWFDKNGIGIDGSLKWQTLEQIFWDVTHVCMWGSAERAQRFADTLHSEKYPDSERSPIEPIGKTERFSLYKVGKIISVSHGMGMPSMSILLNEIAKMLYYAKWNDIWRLRDEVSFIRIGTSGWVWVEWWTVVIAKNGVNPKWKKEHTETILWQDITFPTTLNADLSWEILAANTIEEVGKEIQVVLWDTIGTNDFYEGQGRLDGFFAPWYTEKDKLWYLEKLYTKWVRNFEMESTCFAAFCLKAWLPGAIVCVALLNRLIWDQVTANLDEISENAEKIVLNYLQKVQAI